MERTIILALKSSEQADTLVRKFSDAGLHVMGPAPRASHALALAAQSPAKLAVIGLELGGRRNGAQLADDLRVNWGIHSLFLEDDRLGDGELSDHPMAQQVRGVLSTSAHV